MFSSLIKKPSFSIEASMKLFCGNKANLKHQRNKSSWCTSNMRRFVAKYLQVLRVQNDVFEAKFSYFAFQKTFCFALICA